MLNPLISSVLSHIENQEAKLLSWGVTNGSFTLNELHEIISRSTPIDTILTPDESEDVLRHLIQANYLFQIPQEAYQGEVRYRSRMAEGVRLLTKLKQLFHKSMNEPFLWRAAKPLVGDYRLILRPRTYPRRDLDRSHVTSILNRALSPVQSDLLSTLLPDGFNLSRFQLKSTVRIFNEVKGRDRQESGTIVCAGTGCGKTLSFYLPALLMLADLASQERWTRAIAIYPRNELLKDQLASAIGQVLTLNEVLKRHGKSTVQIGVLYSDVPNTLEDIAGRVFDDKKNDPKWKKHSGDRYICPYLVCPHSNRTTPHEGEMLWDPSYPSQLRCASQDCGFTLTEDVFPISRDQMKKRPPDLLFTSVEILNQQLSNTSSHSLLGKHESLHKRPRLVLLDEVHTYCGTYGAQVALMLRRWRAMCDITAHYVGLSATLEDASRFFSDLVGIKEHRIEEISPVHGDLEVSGQEVLLALKGEPSSGASLLSTTIQATMLLRRLLEPSPNSQTPPREKSLYGSKIFAFTDDLDVTNRLFDILLETESTQLASLRRSLVKLSRSSTHEEKIDFFHEGQRWLIAEKLQHDLTQGAKVSRTSSQDRGVDPNAEIIIATAALEVGFDDDQVGAVIQHKAPKDAASFLQRKGRAGRTRGTHPWTVVILSDFGRDRVTYQSYEQLFSPVLKPYHLPLQNLYILRMQGVYMLLDWLSTRISADRSVWYILSAPIGSSKMNHRVRAQLIRILQQVSDSSTPLHKDFTAYLRRAIFGRETPYIEEHEKREQSRLIEQILWNRPRGLMIEVIPTALRRLHTQWRTVNGKSEDYKRNSPLPEFIPDMLFSDLNLPEVEIQISQRKTTSKPILRAMSELAPGRVTKGLSSLQNQAYWIPIPEQVLTGQQRTIEISEFTIPESWEQYGESYFAQIKQSVERFRPRKLKVCKTPKFIQNTSNSFHIWIWDFTTPMAMSPTSLTLPRHTPWRRLIDQVQVFSHRDGNPVTAHRYSIGVRYNILKEHQRAQGEAYFVHQGRRASLGFEIEVDAIRIQLKVPHDLLHKISESPHTLRALRRDYFAHCIQSDQSIAQSTNEFDREHLIQGTLSTLIWYAIEHDCSLERATTEVFEHNQHLIQLVSERLFAMTLDSPDPTEKIERVRDLLKRADVQECLYAHSKILWQPTEEIHWRAWLLERYRSTIGVAFLETSQQICADIDLNDLYLDLPVMDDDSGEHLSLWISERHPGGNGIIEKIESAYINDPRAFWRHATSVLDQGEFEIIDQSLQRTLELLTSSTETPLVQIAKQARKAIDHGIQETQRSNQRLMSHLSAQGVVLTHPVMHSMQNRIFRAGSNEHTDTVLAKVVTQWNESEARLGVEIDPQVIAYSFRDDPTVQQVFNTPLQSEEVADRWRYSVLYSLLWPRGGHIRKQSVSVYNPYQKVIAGDRLIVAPYLQESVRSLILDPQDLSSVVQKVIQLLTEHGLLELWVPHDQQASLTPILTEIIAHPVDIGMLLVYPYVVGVRRCTRYLTIQIELRETII